MKLLIDGGYYGYEKRIGLQEMLQKDTNVQSNNHK
jgi:hypothetical protein